jgi:outer membrane protein assembly factor BamD (BamD/ComL family)
MPTARPTPDRRSVALIVTAFALAASVGCTSTVGGKKDKSFRQKVTDSLKATFNSSYHDPDADDKLSRADELFASTDYGLAQKIYADLADNTHNAAQMREKARFQEAECCRLRKKLPAAVATYNRYLQDHPGGVYSTPAAERMFVVAEGWREDVMKDLDASAAGRWQMPRMPNLSDDARPTMDLEGELVKTYENIAVGAPTAGCAEKAMFWAGYLHYVRGRYEDADHFFSTLAEMYKDSPLRQDAVKYAIESKSRVVGGPYYDPQKSNEALQLVHNLEATEPEYRSDPAKQEWVTKQKLGIRANQAEHDFETAEYYRRSGRAGSAYWCYELVKRRYPGTKFSDLADMRIQEIQRTQTQKDEDRAAGRVRPLEAMQERLDALFSNKPKADAEPSVEPARAGPAGKSAPIVPAGGGFDGR